MLLLRQVLDFLQSRKDAFEALAAIFTAVGIMVAGFWTWLLFVRGREKFPKAELGHTVIAWDLPDSSRLIRVHLRISNKGKVLIPLSTGFTWVQRLAPLPEHFTGVLKDHMTQVVPTEDDKARENEEAPLKETQIQWPLLSEKKFSFQGQTEIEPGEADDLIFDFVVENTIQKVLIYSFVLNGTKPGRNIGWTVSTIFDVGSPATAMQVSQQQSPPKTRPAMD